LLNVLQLTETDMTIFYRRLAELDIHSIAKTDLSEIPQPLEEAYYQMAPLKDDQVVRICRWLKDYANRSVLEFNDSGKTDRKLQMNRVNPKYVLRNYLAQLAIEQSEQGEHSILEELLEVMRQPYDEQPDYEKYAEKRPEWARHKAGCSMLSCSS